MLTTLCRPGLRRPLRYAIRTAVFVIGSFGLVGTAEAQSPAGVRALGAVFDESSYLDTPAAPPLARGDYDDVPSAYSLKKFAPRVESQGGQGSCVGWATSYAARSILNSKRSFETTQSLPDQDGFSPSFVYNQIQRHGCDPGGSRISDALQLMKVQGVVSINDFPYDDRYCSDQPGDRLRSLAFGNRITEYQRLFSSQTRNKHVPVRLALAQGRPVVIGMWVADGFHDVDGVYRLTPDEKYLIESGQAGGHAMAVVGYDDGVLGGAFQIMNSWGTEWGDEGFFWVTYEDFNFATKQGFSLYVSDPPAPAPEPEPEPEPAPKPEPEPAPAPTPALMLSGGLRILDMQGNDIPFTRKGTHFALRDPMPSGARFRTELSLNGDGYVYLFGADKSGSFVELFPRAQRTSPLLFGGSTMLLPGPTEAYFTRLNDTVGTDYYLLLVSRGELDSAKIASFAVDLNFAAPEALLDSLTGVLPVALPTTTAALQVEAPVAEGEILPLLITIDHRAPDPSAIDTQAPAIVLSAMDPHDLRADKDTVTVSSPSRDIVLRGNAQDISAIRDLTVQGALSVRYSSKGPFEARLSLPEGQTTLLTTIEATDAVGNRSALQLLVEYRP